MGEPATARALPEPKAPDMDKLLVLTSRMGIEFV
jgi:hypothetical protein